LREPEVQLRAVEEPKVEGLDTAQVQRVVRDEHLVPAAHGKAVPELAERGVPNGGGAYGRGFYNAPRADDYLEGQRPGWSSLEQRRIKEYNDPNLEYYDNLKDTKDKIRQYDRGLKARDKALDRNREIVLRAERDGVEVGSPGYELHPVPEAPKKPALRIFRDELYKNKDGTRAKLDFSTGMEGSDSGNKSYLITRPSEYGEKIPDEVFETGENILTNRNLDITSNDLRFKDYNNLAQPMIKNEAGDPVKHKYRALPTHAENGVEVDYFEATVNVPGSSGKDGSHRLVIASNGSMFYTPTHYEKFVLIKE
jgi:ribonuclease